MLILRKNVKRRLINTADCAIIAMSWGHNNKNLPPTERGTKMKKQYHNEHTIITENTVYPIANAITIKALQTHFSKSGSTLAFDLMLDAMAFSRATAKKEYPMNYTAGNGADLIQETCLFLWQYDGKRIDEPTTDSKTTKDGEPITILRSAFYNINNVIHSLRQKELKQVYIIDYEENYGEIAVPSLWDIDNYEDYITVDRMINDLDLTDNQMWVLNKRLQGFSLREIAGKKGVTHRAISKTLEQIAQKYITIYGEIAVPAMKKAKA